MALLDKIYEVEGMRWAGNANELNAGYAADGYARVNPNGLSALVSTFGVGELSLTNAIAGSYSEHVGVINLVGVPSSSAQAKQLLLHHTLGNGDFTVFHRMFKTFLKPVPLLLILTLLQLKLTDVSEMLMFTNVQFTLVYHPTWSI